MISLIDIMMLIVKDIDYKIYDSYLFSNNSLTTN